LRGWATSAKVKPRLWLVDDFYEEGALVGKQSEAVSTFDGFILTPSRFKTYRESEEAILLSGGMVGETGEVHGRFSRYVGIRD
jgi:hypothetical protein